MSILSRKQKSKPARLHPQNKHMHLEETLIAISPIIIVIMVFILIIMLIVTCGPVFSSEANHYEHMEKFVLYIGGRLLC
jgi:heme/copper-type cytochrome/quinol oxidase subunit 2